MCTLAPAVFNSICPGGKSGIFRSVQKIYIYMCIYIIINLSVCDSRNSIPEAPGMPTCFLVGSDLLGRNSD